MIRPMNDFYLYPNEPLYIQAKDSDFRLTIRYLTDLCRRVIKC